MELPPLAPALPYVISVILATIAWLSVIFLSYKLVKGFSKKKTRDSEERGFLGLSLLFSSMVAATITISILSNLPDYLTALDIISAGQNGALLIQVMMALLILFGFSRLIYPLLPDFDEPRGGRTL